jgi:hypothetical protein
MSYTPTNWATGDVITAVKLNKLEQGVASAGGATVVPYTIGDSSVIQMKASELLDACKTGVVFILYAADDAPVSCELINSADFYNNAYTFTAGGNTFTAESGNDYPASGGK